MPPLDLFFARDDYPPEQRAFQAATEAIAALCAEAAKARASGNPGAVARCSELLTSAGALRALVRDRLLCIPACAAEGRSSGETDRAAQQRARAAGRLIEAMGLVFKDLPPAARHILAAAARDRTPAEEGPAVQAYCGAAAAETDALPGGSSCALDIPGLSAAYARHRAQSLAKELTAVRAAAAWRLGLPGQKAQQLLGIVEALRRAESSLALQSRLARAAAAAALDECKAGSSVSVSEAAAVMNRQQAAAVCTHQEADFAYGSTPLVSWLKVYSHPAVAAAAAAALAPPCPAQQHAPCHSSSSSGPGGSTLVSDASSASGDWTGEQQQQSRRYCVWGSSTGWLVFYGALAAGWPRCDGVELLPCLVEVAREVADQFNLQGVSFQQGDLRDASLAGVAVLQLTEQCWGAELVEQAAAKINAELEPGALVVDYTGAVVKRLRGKVIAVVTVPTSWGFAKMHACVVEAKSPHT